jgi:adenine phosphoribosyltransferase
MKYDIDLAIRKVPNFPKKGILFYDITGILRNPVIFQQIIDEIADFYSSKSLTHLIAIESRGFLFAAPLGLRLKLPIILARKKGKLPHKTISRSYSLEYGQATLEIQEVDLEKNMNVLLVDDLIATGGTLKATAEMLQSKGVTVKHIFSVIGLPFLQYQNALKDYTVKTLINYDTELVEGEK